MQKKNNIKVYYYISPKLWAWKEYRVKKVKAFVDEMFTIFPFETEFYKKHDFKVNYVGNPLMDSIHEYKNSAQHREDFYKKNKLDDRPVVALLSGSRIKEIKRILPVMVKASEGVADFQFVIAGVGSMDIEIYQKIIDTNKISIVFDQTYDLLSYAHTALVASGTAALETALFNVPQTVLYKVEGGRIVDFIMRDFVLKTNWVSLPNIILGKTVVVELLQKDMTVKKVKEELYKLLFDNDYRNKMISDYSNLKMLMGEPGCSKRAASKMLATLNPKL